MATKVYFCLAQKETARPVLVEHSIGGGIHFLMDRGNYHAQEVMLWLPAKAADLYDKGFTDEQLPLRASSVIHGSRTRFIIDAVCVDEHGKVV